MVNKIKTHEDHTDEERKKEEYTNRIFLNRGKNKRVYIKSGKKNS